MARTDWPDDQPHLANHSRLVEKVLLGSYLKRSSLSFTTSKAPSAMAATAVNMKLRPLHFHSPRANPHAPSFSPPLTNTTTSHASPTNLSLQYHGLSHPNPTVVARAALDKDSLVPSDEAEDGVLLGTMKLPDNTDFPRFQILLFQVPIASSFRVQILIVNT